MKKKGLKLSFCDKLLLKWSQKPQVEQIIFSGAICFEAFIKPVTGFGGHKVLFSTRENLFGPRVSRESKECFSFRGVLVL